jgi:hypothetical protein
LNEKVRRKMAATTGDGRWTITATTTVRGNARGGEEEVHAMKEDEGVGGRRGQHTTDDEDRQNNTTIKRFTGEGVGGDGEE